MEIENIVGMVDFSKMSYDGVQLVPVVVQCIDTGKVLMQPFMNSEALRRTLETKVATYWSRSRNGLWIKGETSGSSQKVKELYLDCDNDSVLLLVEQKGRGCLPHGQLQLLLQEDEIKNYLSHRAK